MPLPCWCYILAAWLFYCVFVSARGYHSLRHRLPSVETVEISEAQVLIQDHSVPDVLYPESAWVKQHLERMLSKGMKQRQRFEVMQPLAGFRGCRTPPMEAHKSSDSGSQDSVKSVFLHLGCLADDWWRHETSINECAFQPGTTWGPSAVSNHSSYQLFWLRALLPTWFADDVDGDKLAADTFAAIRTKIRDGTLDCSGHPGGEAFLRHLASAGAEAALPPEFETLPPFAKASPFLVAIDTALRCFSVMFECSVLVVQAFHPDSSVFDSHWDANAEWLRATQHQMCALQYEGMSCRSICLSEGSGQAQAVLGLLGNFTCPLPSRHFRPHHPPTLHHHPATHGLVARSGQ